MRCQFTRRPSAPRFFPHNHPIERQNGRGTGHKPVTSERPSCAASVDTQGHRHAHMAKRDGFVFVDDQPRICRFFGWVGSAATASRMALPILIASAAGGTKASDRSSFPSKSKNKPRAAQKDRVSAAMDGANGVRLDGRVSFVCMSPGRAPASCQGNGAPAAADRPGRWLRRDALMPGVSRWGPEPITSSHCRSLSQWHAAGHPLLTVSPEIMEEKCEGHTHDEEAAKDEQKDFQDEPDVILGRRDRCAPCCHASPFDCRAGQGVRPCRGAHSPVAANPSQTTTHCPFATTSMVQPVNATGTPRPHPNLSGPRALTACSPAGKRRCLHSKGGPLRFGGNRPNDLTMIFAKRHYLNW